MRKMDSSGLLLCRYQADLFEYSAKQKYPSRVFIKTFCYSSLSKRLNNVAFLFESIDIPKAYNEVIKGVLLEGSVIFNIDVIRWIGYIYRYICYIYEISMKRIYKYLKPQDLYNLYDAYHSVDNELAIKRILEAKNIDLTNNKNNVILLKQIYGYE